jgi:hypothetical protein
MAETVCTLYDIMIRAAEDVDELEFFRITAISTSGTAHVECDSQAAAASNVYRYGIGRVSGKGARQITASGGAYTTGTGTGGKFTLSPALSTGAVVGDTLDVAWWNEKGYGKILAASKAAITASSPYWYREVRLDLNHDVIADGTTEFTMLTFDSDTDEYTAPVDMVRLGKIGIHPGEDADAEVEWFDWLDLYDVLGQEGGLRLKFYRGAGGEYLPSKYNGKTICWHYEAREPIPATPTTASCQLPLEAVGMVAANIYKRRNLFRADSELRTEGAAIPQLQAAAAEAWARLGVVKKPLPNGIVYRKH